MNSYPDNFPSLFFKQVERYGSRVALRRKQYGIWNRISWTEYGQRVKETAAGLLAGGLKHGNRVAILGDNRPEWLICHLACMCSGGVTVGVYSTSSADQLLYELDHSDACFLFVENEEQVDKVLQIMADIDLKQIVIWDSKGLWGFSHQEIIFYDEFVENGRKWLEKNPGCVEERIDKIEPEDVAMMIYTSGTTGRPKGAMLSHKNISFIIQSIMEANPVYATDEMISYLPLAHIYENAVSLFQAVTGGGTVSFVESMDTLPLNLREVSPTMFASVPRIWEKFASTIEIKISDTTSLKRALYRLAIKAGLRYVRVSKDTRERFFRGLLYWPLYWLVLYPLKRQLGFERIRHAGCAAAPAAVELFEFYNALGIPLREGYGQTESTGLIAMQRLDRPRWNYVGEPIPGCEVKIADDGEILARGDGIFKGYHKAPELTAETIIDGWLHTGDIGVMDDGFLKIIDRKKDIIITAGGKNITPAYIENKLKFSLYIQDAIVIGERRKYLIALILIDEDNVIKYAQDHRIPFTTFASLTQNPEICELVGDEIEKVNETLAKVETIKKFELLPKRFYEEDGDVTPTKKVKRRFIEKRYTDLIEKMYNG